jgi:hypothetical protein
MLAMSSGRSSVFRGKEHLVDQLGRLGADRVGADDLLGRRIEEDLDHSLRLLDGHGLAGPAIGKEALE